MKSYKSYIKKRNFRYFREKDQDTGQYKSIKEAALIYSFETYIQVYLEEMDGKSYLEPHTGLRRCDLVINVQGKEYVIESKIYRSIKKFNEGKKQLAYYCKSISIQEGIYLVFISNKYDWQNLKITEDTEMLDNIQIKTYLVFYDVEKDF